MSSKTKKKKRVSAHKQKYLKAECRNHFFKRIEHICSLVDGEDIFRLIPKEVLEDIYKRRGLPFKFISGAHDLIPPEKIKSLSHWFNLGMNVEKISITKEGKTITLFEFFTIGIGFFNYAGDIKENDFRDAVKVKELAGRFLTFNELYETAYSLLVERLNMSAFVNHEITTRIYWLTHKHSFKKSARLGIENIVTVHSSVPDKIHIYKEDKCRPVFRVCWGLALSGVKNCQASSSLFGIQNGGEDRKLDVYIQAHAVQRLKERLDCMEIRDAYLWLVASFHDLKVHKSKNGAFLLEYNIHGIVLGYLVAEIHEGVLVIMTFLFLTQTGTPEGEKLKELYGLGKLDVSYIALDKLSTYVLNDLCTNKALSEIFQTAGCQYLLDIYTDKIITGVCFEKEHHTSIELMTKYLKLKSNETGKS
jgi:hypothetical protein